MDIPKLRKNLIKVSSEVSLQLRKTLEYSPRANSFAFFMFEEPAITNQKRYTHPYKINLVCNMAGQMKHVSLGAESHVKYDSFVQLFLPHWFLCAAGNLPLTHLLAIKYWLLPVLFFHAIFMPSSWQSLGGTHAQFGLLSSLQEVTVLLYLAQNNFLSCLLILRRYWSELAMASSQIPTWLLSVPSSMTWGQKIRSQGSKAQGLLLKLFSSAPDRFCPSLPWLGFETGVHCMASREGL